MVGLDFTGIKRVLCLGAHSDDIEIGCGGTILKFVEAYPKAEFYWVVFSGSPLRQEEARASAGQFLKDAAANTFRTHAFRESYFPSEWALIKDAIEGVRREFEPDLVFTHYRKDRHQDHRVLSDLVWNTFRNHLILEYEIPKYDGDLGVPNLFVKLDPLVSKRKVALVQQYFRTQKDKHWFEEETLLSLMRLRGVECASESGYAEAFYARKVIWRCW